MRTPRPRRSGGAARSREQDTHRRAPIGRPGRAVTHRGAALVLAVTIACGRSEERLVESTTSAPDAPVAAAVDPPDSATIASAVEALDRFLDASREGSATRSTLRELTACDSGDEPPVAGPMLAAYKILPATSRADTVVGRAVVTTVAEQDLDRRHPGYYIARLRVRSDTLEWDVVPTASGGWVVCNGLAFGLTAPDSLIEWRPQGASWSRARALADSIAATAASPPTTRP